MTTPELAATARTLVERAASGVLSTLHPNGYPFGSLVEVACDASGRPLLLLSRLAEHTKNLEADPRASLLVTERDAAEPLAAPRATILGVCRRVDAGERDAVAVLYLGRHPRAATWAAFADFGFFRLEPAEVRIVAGFGKMSWVTAAEYARAHARP